MTIDTGNTGFMLLCSSLVMLMTPGLAFFYGGLVGRKNVLAIMIQSFVSMGWTTMLWWLCGFSMCFSGDLKSGTDFAGVIGNFDWAMLRGITLDMPSTVNPSIPMIVFCAYQMMFAIITPALITGAFTNRVTFKAYMLFLTGWLLLVYFPFVHMVWGGGFLAEWGVKDFAGGIVVHNIAGIAALVLDGEEDKLGAAELARKRHILRRGEAPRAGDGPGEMMEPAKQGTDRVSLRRCAGKERRQDIVEQRFRFVAKAAPVLGGSHRRERRAEHPHPVLLQNAGIVERNGELSSIVTGYRTDLGEDVSSDDDPDRRST